MHGAPVLTVVLLLRREADGRELTGRLIERLPNGTPYLEFGYTVVRLWEQPVEALLTGDLNLVPLAPVSNLGGRAVAEVVQAAADRFEREAAGERGETLWTSLLTVLRLQYDAQQVEQIVDEVRVMAEVRTLGSLLREARAEGRVEGQRALLLEVGDYRFGPPDETTLSRIEAISDPAEIDALKPHLLSAGSWVELLSHLPPRDDNTDRPTTG